MPTTDLPVWARAFVARYGVPPIAGGADEPPTEDDTDDEPPTDDDEPPEADDDTDDKPPEDDTDAEPTEAAKLKARMKAADKRADRFGKERDTARSERDALKVELAVRKAMYEGKHRYEDPELVLSLVRDHVVLKDGEPQKVEEALAWLRERHPYLLADEHEPPDDKVQPEQPLGKSGSHANRQRGGASRALDRKALHDKYRALRK